MTRAAAWSDRILRADPVRRSGRIERIHATYWEADGPAVPLGTICEIEARDRSDARSAAEVIRVDRDSITLSPLRVGAKVMPGARVVAVESPEEVPVGEAFLGRVVDALGYPRDGRSKPASQHFGRLFEQPASPLDRASPKRILETGLRAIDGLLPLACGQRVGIFAAAGVGKTSLIEQILRHVVADVVVVALIGERGREVEALWRELPAERKANTIMVAATSDELATMRVRAAHYATAQAEYWRAQGKHVVLVMDSMTRLAIALRELGLAAGEPPTLRAYTPNVFAQLPRVIERAGATKAGGAISAFYTVLCETDEIDDPLAELLKSLLDGHVQLSRELAEDGHFPAIDVLRSVSRQAGKVLSDRQLSQARRVVSWLAAFERSRLTREAGLYVAGSDSRVDGALRTREAVVAFLRQGLNERATAQATHATLAKLAEKEAVHAAA